MPSVLVNASEPTNYNKTKDEVNASRVSGFLNEKQCCNEEWRNRSAKISGFSLSHATVASKKWLENNPSFQGLKPLKRVAFHSSTFLIDPPQQIPLELQEKVMWKFYQMELLIYVHLLTKSDSRLKNHKGVRRWDSG